jgi:hypothetical protein
MNKFLIIIGSLLALIGVGYVFIKPSFMVHSIDGSTQTITYEFDKQTYTYKSGIGKADVIKSRGYTLRIKDSIVGFGSIAITGSIIVEILQYDRIIQTYEIKPSEQGFYLWNWNKK